MGRGPEQPLLDVFLRPIGAFGWQAARLAEASTVLPGDVADYSVFYESFQGKRAEWTDHTLGGGAITPQALSGGVWTYSAPTGAGARYAYSDLATDNPPTVPCSFDSAQPWYMAGRWRLRAFGDGTTGSAVMMGGNSQQFSFVFLVNGEGGIPNRLGLQIEGAAPDFNFLDFDTGITIDTKFHDTALWAADGKNIFLRYDGTTLGPFDSTTPGPFNTGNALGGLLTSEVHVLNVGGTVALTLDEDEFLIVGSLTP